MFNLFNNLFLLVKMGQCSVVKPEFDRIFTRVQAKLEAQKLAT